MSDALLVGYITGRRPRLEDLFQGACPHGDRLLGNGSWTAKTPAQVEIYIEGQTRKYFVIDGNLWNDEVEHGPLNNRGWVSQERYLARRIAHFGESQLAWECREWRALEMFPNGLPRWLGVPRAKFEHTIAATERASQSTQAQAVELATVW